MSTEKRFVAKEGQSPLATQRPPFTAGQEPKNVREMFITHYAYAMYGGEREMITKFLDAVWTICTIDKSQKIIKTLHEMYLCCVRHREELPDGLLDDITTLYQCLKDFYEADIMDEEYHPQD
jgi:hypothetical protein